MLWSPFLQNTCKRRDKRPTDVSTDGCRQGPRAAVSMTTWPATGLHPASGERGKPPQTPTHPCPYGATPKKLPATLLLLLPVMLWPKTHSERGQEGIWTGLGHIQSKYQQQEVGERREEGLILDVSFFFPSENCTVHFDTKQKLTNFPNFLSATPTIPAFQPAPADVRG